MSTEVVLLGFGECLGDLLHERGLNASDLADLIHVHPSLVQKWVRGERTPNLNTIYFELIAEALCLPDVKREGLREAQKVSWLAEEFVRKAKFSRTRAYQASALVWRTFGRVVRLTRRRGLHRRAATGWLLRPLIRLDAKLQSKIPLRAGQELTELEVWNSSDEAIPCHFVVRDFDGRPLRSRIVHVPGSGSAVVRVHTPLSEREYIAFVDTMRQEQGQALTLLWTKYMVSPSGEKVPLGSSGGYGGGKLSAQGGALASLRSEVPLLVRDYHGFDSTLWVVNPFAMAPTNVRIEIYRAPKRGLLGDKRPAVALSGPLRANGGFALHLRQVDCLGANFLGWARIEAQPTEGGPAQQVVAVADIIAPNGRFFEVSATTPADEVEALLAYIQGQEAREPLSPAAPQRRLEPLDSPGG